MGGWGAVKPNPRNAWSSGWSVLSLIAAAGAAPSCVGRMADPPPATAGQGAGHDPQRVIFRLATRRLAKTELRQTVIDLVGVDPQTDLAAFPDDWPEANDVFAFDSRYALQHPSAALLEAAQSLAESVAERAVADQGLRKRLVGCTPSGPADKVCLRQFVTGFGRRALRRPLSPKEVKRYVEQFRPFAAETGDFYTAVELVIRALLQEMEFLYRVEIGQPVRGRPSLVRLTGYEVASRLSYLLWGSAPDDVLLDAAGTGDRLQTPESIRAAAARMLADPRGRRGVEKFHALWLGWGRTPPPERLQKSMLEETNALLTKVIFEDKGSWLDLFRAKETYVDRELGKHYGLTAPLPAKGRAWVSYEGTGRQGLLSHGTFLGAERKHSDTSPTMRGLHIRTRLLCQRIPPPSGEIDTANPPSKGNCKIDRYDAISDLPRCEECHGKMDPIGFGLENYDQLGRFRRFAPDEDKKPECEIAGEGELTPVGAFKGPAELGDKLVESRLLESCMVTQLGHNLLGRELVAEEKPLFDELTARFGRQGHRFDQLLLDIVTLPGFVYRYVE
jgi:hypothetical protein